jgi:RecA/RadA recombinase
MATAKDLFSKYHKIKKPQMSSGVLPLDIQLAGGPCLGGMYAIGSPEGGGKSTLILQACKKLIEVDGLKVLYCDIEQGVSDELLKSMGMYYYPEETFNLVHTVSTFSELAELTNDLLENRDTFHYDVFIIDSLTATATKQFQFDDPEARKVAYF